MEDEDIRLRDQLAMAALPAIVERVVKRNDHAWILKGKITSEGKEDMKLFQSYLMPLLTKCEKLDWNLLLKQTKGRLYG